MRQEALRSIEKRHAHPAEDVPLISVNGVAGAARFRRTVFSLVIDRGRRESDVAHYVAQRLL